MWQLQSPPLKKVTRCFLATPSKSWGPAKPLPFWKFGWRLNCPPPLQKGGVGVHYAKLVHFFSLGLFIPVGWYLKKMLNKKKNKNNFFHSTKGNRKLLRNDSKGDLINLGLTLVTLMQVLAHITYQTK